VYEFGPCALDVRERRLWNAGHVVPLAPKARDVLVALVRRAGTLVTKRELLDLAWGDLSVEEGVLSVYVSALRKSLGDSGESATYIETVPRAGYRLRGHHTKKRTRRTAVDEVPNRRAGALLQIEDPRSVAEVIADFLKRHPILESLTRPHDNRAPGPCEQLSCPTVQRSMAAEAQLRARSVTGSMLNTSMCSWYYAWKAACDVGRQPP